MTNHEIKVLQNATGLMSPHIKAKVEALIEEREKLKEDNLELNCKLGEARAALRTLRDFFVVPDNNINDEPGAFVDALMHELKLREDQLTKHLNAHD